MRGRRDVFLGLGLVTIVLGTLFAVIMVITGRDCTNFVTGEPCLEYGALAKLLAGCGIVATGFFLLAWRNSAGIRAEKRHREQLRAMKGQSASVDADAVILKKASALWNEGKKSEALLLLETIPDNPTAKRILQKAKHTQ